MIDLKDLFSGFYFTCAVIFIYVSFVNQDRIQQLRNIEIRGKYKKYPTERYLDRIYVPEIPGSKSYICFTMVDEELQKVDFSAVYILFWSFENSDNILRNQK